MVENGLQVREVRGHPIRVGEREITPVAQAISFTLRGPWGGGGWVWNRPVAVLETTAEGTRRIPIWDVTRWAQLGLLALALLLVMRRLGGGR